MTCLRVLHDHNNEVVSLSLDGDTFVSGAYGAIKVWSLSRMECVQTLRCMERTEGGMDHVERPHRSEWRRFITPGGFDALEEAKCGLSLGTVRGVVGELRSGLGRHCGDAPVQAVALGRLVLSHPHKRRTAGPRLAP